MQCITARLHTHTHIPTYLHSSLLYCFYLLPHLLINWDVITQCLSRIQHSQLHMSKHTICHFLTGPFCHLIFANTLFFFLLIFRVFFFLPQRKNCRSSLVCKITETSGTGHERILSGLVLCEFWAQACPGTCIHLEWVHSGPESFMLFVYEHVLHIS